MSTQSKKAGVRFTQCTSVIQSPSAVCDWQGLAPNKRKYISSSLYEIFITSDASDEDVAATDGDDDDWVVANVVATADEVAEHETAENVDDDGSGVTSVAEDGTNDDDTVNDDDGDGVTDDADLATAADDDRGVSSIVVVTGDNADDGLNDDDGIRVISEHGKASEAVLHTSEHAPCKASFSKYLVSAFSSASKYTASSKLPEN